MPELPEVENIAAGLREAIVGDVLQCVEVRRPGIIKGPHRRRWRRFPQDVTGRQIAHITRRAKRLIITADNNLTLLFQLGMTGKFLLGCEATSGHADEWARHTQVVLHLQDGRVVRFIDTRRFGRLWLLDTLAPDAPDEAMRAAGLGPLGPEALSMSVEAFRQLMQANRPIKPLLLDQGQPCRTCGTPIERIVVVGRGTHFCPACQPRARAKSRKQRSKQLKR